MRDKIIIIEDDAALAAGLGRALASQQRDIRICGKLADARKLMAGSTPALIILDVNLAGWKRVRVSQGVAAAKRCACDTADCERYGDRYRQRAGNGRRRLYHQTLQPCSAPRAGEHAASQKSDTGNRSMPGEIPLRFSVHGVLCRGKAGGAQQDGAEAVEDLY